MAKRFFQRCLILGTPVLSLFVTTLVIQLCNGSIGPILTLFIQSLAPHTTNIAFLSGLIAAIPGVSALISHRGLANWAIALARRAY